MVYDQAEGLRKKILKAKEKTPSPSALTTKVITITSGKGGVGKSNFALNFALALRDYQHRTAILDADIGLANLDVLMGMTPKYTLQDMIVNKLSIWDIIEKGPNGLNLIAGGSGIDVLLDPNKNDLSYLFYQFQLLNGHMDTILIDTGAGLSKESLKFIMSSDEVFLVTTPEPTSITDAYAIIKMISTNNKKMKISLIINRISNEKEGLNTAERIKVVAKRFLQVDIHVLGYIYDDRQVSLAVKKQEPFYLSYPNSKASRNIKHMVEMYLSERELASIESESNFSNGVRNFIEKMTYWVKR